MTDRRGIARLPLRLLLLAALMLLAVLPLAWPTESAISTVPVSGYHTAPAVSGLR